MILQLVRSGTFSFYNKFLRTFYGSIYSVHVGISHDVLVLQQDE